MSPNKLRPVVQKSRKASTSKNPLHKSVAPTKNKGGRCASANAFLALVVGVVFVVVVADGTTFFLSSARAAPCLLFLACWGLEVLRRAAIIRNSNYKEREKE